MKKLVETRVVAVSVTRQEKIGDSGFRSVPDGHHQGTIELYIDIEALGCQLGAKALRSKSGRSTYASGLIEARLVKGSVTRHPLTDRDRLYPRGVIER